MLRRCGNSTTFVFPPCDGTERLVPASTGAVPRPDPSQGGARQVFNDGSGAVIFLCNIFHDYRRSTAHQNGLLSSSWCRSSLACNRRSAISALRSGAEAPSKACSTTRSFRSPSAPCSRSSPRVKTLRRFLARPPRTIRISGALKGARQDWRNCAAFRLMGRGEIGPEQAVSLCAVVGAAGSCVRVSRRSGTAVGCRLPSAGFAEMAVVLDPC